MGFSAFKWSFKKWSFQGNSGRHFWELLGERVADAGEFCQEATVINIQWSPVANSEEQWVTVVNSRQRWATYSGQQWWARGAPLTLLWCMWLVSSVALPTSFSQSNFSNSPNWLGRPREDVLEGHLLPEEPLLLDVEVAGGKVLEVGEGARRQGRVDARGDGEGGPWKQSNWEKLPGSKSLEFSSPTMP